MIEGVQLRVSMARRQPTFDPQSTDQPSTESWATIGKYFLHFFISSQIALTR